MLETVASRRLYGFLVLTILPASAGLGYYLRTREDARLAALPTATTPSTSSAAPTAAPPPTTNELEAKLRSLRSLDAALKKEDDDLRVKLARVGGGAKAV